MAPMMALICLKKASKKLIVLAYYSRNANWKKEKVK